VLDTEPYRFLHYDFFLCSHFFLIPRKENIFVSPSQDGTWYYKSPNNAFEKFHNLFHKLRGEFFICKQVSKKKDFRDWFYSDGG